MNTVIKIEGMSCEHCVKHIREALEGLAGVKSAKVSLKDKSASVEHSPDLNPDALKAAVAEAGYEAGLL